MALVKATLKAALKQALVDELGGGITSDQLSALDRVAGKFADAIDTFVKSGTVAAGIPVSTTGTAAAQTGATTGPGTIS